MCNPRLGKDIEIIDARISSVILRATSAAILEFFARAATRYLVRRPIEAIKPLPFGALSGARVTDPKCIDSRTSCTGGHRRCDSTNRGNFHLLVRLLTQMERVLKINGLESLSVTSPKRPARTWSLQA